MVFGLARLESGVEGLAVRGFGWATANDSGLLGLSSVPASGASGKRQVLGFGLLGAWLQRSEFRFWGCAAD